MLSAQIITQIIQNGRQTGKTSAVMAEIHDLIVAGRGPEVLLVLPDQRRGYFWARQWSSAYPMLPVPEYVTIQNMLRLRGRRFSRAFIEDIHEYEEGIYDPKLEYVWDCLVSPFNDEEVVCTSSPTKLNGRSHSAQISRRDVMARARKMIKQ